MEKSLNLTIFQSPTAAKVISGALLVAVLLVLAGLSWKLVELFRGATLPVASTVAVAGPGKAEPAYNVQSLLAVPLFGEKPAEAQSSDAVSGEDVKVSALKIEVLGLVAGEGPGGIAVLKHGSKTRAYAVGEEIDVPGNVKLLAVKGDHILIENNRRREKIELEKRAAVAGVSAAPVSTGDDIVDVRSPEVIALIGDPRDTLQNSPLKLARFFTVSPVMDGGQLQGYALSPGRDKRLFEMLSIKTGDILLSVNGQPLSDLSTPELMKLLENTSSFELLVKRNDTILTKRLDL